MSINSMNSAGANLNSRRRFLRSASALMIASTLKTKADAAASGTFGIAYTSFPVRTRQAAAVVAGRGPKIFAHEFIDLCRSFGSAGCQMDFAQLSSTEPDYLKTTRAALEQHGMFLELSVSSQVLDDREAFARVARAAHQLGVSRLRVALLSGRRYENFQELTKWKEFANESQRILRRVEPLLKQHQLMVGIENHKDWLADELAWMLSRVSSSYLGACVDFGNNLALLEDSVEVAEKLAPYVVTTHLKDMALTPYDHGFELSEVALGDGFLPLAKIIRILRKARPDVHLCLEMITRDPLKIPYRDESYWATYEKRNPARVRKFETTLLTKAATKPLPRMSDLTSDQMLTMEDDNIRRSAAYAKRTLGL